MLKFPKALTIGLTAERDARVLYIGDDVVEGLKPFGDAPRDVHQLFFFRSGVQVKGRETDVAITIRNARLADSMARSKANNEKALADQKAAAEANARKSDETIAIARAKSAEALKKSNDARAVREAEILSHAAEAAAAKVGQASSLSPSPEEPVKRSKARH